MELNQFLYFNGEVVKLFLDAAGRTRSAVLYLSAGQRRAYFDTTAVAHALDEPCYIVEPHPPGATLPFNGLPVFTLNYVNDDDAGAAARDGFAAALRCAGGWDVPVRVTDTRGEGFRRRAVRVSADACGRRRPDFDVVLEGANAEQSGGDGRVVYGAGGPDRRI